MCHNANVMKGIDVSVEPQNVVVVSIEAGPGAGKKHQFVQRSIAVGRSPDNDVVLSFDKTVSEFHARITVEGNDWVIQDLNSKNGVYTEWNGMYQRIRTQAPIQPGQWFRIGVTCLTVKRVVEEGYAGQAVPFTLGRREQPSTAVLPDAFDDGVEPAREAEKAYSSAGPAPVRSGLVLRVDRDASTLRFQLFSSGAYGTRHTIEFSDDDIQVINDRLGGVVHLANQHRLEGNDEVRREVECTLREVGSFLGEHLFPPRIRKKLVQSEHKNLFLVHDSSLVRIPWELALIDGQTLCRRFNLGRQIMLDDHGSGLFSPRMRTPLRMLIVSNPTGDLPDVQDEAETLFEHLESVEGQVEVDFLAGTRVERTDLLSRLSNTDIVFYVGHADHDRVAPANSGWILERGRITCGDFRRLQTPPSLVFANGCETGKEANWPVEQDGNCGGYGIASGFILGGVQSYVGALWPIPADSATSFAIHFFTLLFAGEPIGKCVRLAREKIVESYGPQEVVWASYVFYGDPGFRLL